jgi:ubiquinone/menaquinone biosynthesis C-methylase UbiE
MPTLGPPPGRAGQFGPKAYDGWRTTTLGAITEAIERRLILRLAGDVNGSSVLDVGCGDGALGLQFWRNGASLVVGCDIDARMVTRAVAAAAKYQAPAHHVIAAAEHLPFRDHSFERVTMITVLAFVLHPEAALQEIARVLKPGGRLILGDLGRWSPWAASRRLRSWLGLAPMWKAGRFRSARQLCRLVQAAGLRPKHTSGAVYYPRSALIARLIGDLDPSLGKLTTFGAAFVAVLAEKNRAR